MTGLRPSNQRIVPAYVLTVQGIHTYHVMAGNKPILVHNDCGPTPLGLGSTGRTTPNNLTEQLAMKQAISNPTGGRVVDLKQGMTDSRWPGSDGWVKMGQHINGVEIHYVRNAVTGAVDDFKFIGR